jgi:hypothetical protein
VRRFNTPEKILAAFLGAVAYGGGILLCTFVLLEVASNINEHVFSMSLDRVLEVSLYAGAGGFLAGAAMVLIRLWEDEQRAPSQRLKP